MAVPKHTHLAFHYDGKLTTLEATVLSVRPFADLEEPNQQLFKQGEGDFIVVTDKTVFHPQGGGQPSDVGTMIATGPDQAVTFEVVAVRMDVVRDGQALHYGRFAAARTDGGSSAFMEGQTVVQSIDADKRLLYSRLHTAGHVLGSAVRRLVEKEVEGFDELKASHFPDQASCEFQGLIEGKWKDRIQKKVNELVAAKLPVQIEWWDQEDFKSRGLESLMPDPSLVAPGEKFRIVNIVGAEVYPCGGTHVETTDLCGPTTVKKISRSKGRSRVSYNVS